MKIKLYPCVEHWKQFDNIYVYSDPHFSDPDMVGKRKNYISDDEQVKRINSKVGKKDMIIFLGDICNTEYIKKIKGYKVLIMGNHDAGASNYEKTVKLIHKLDSEMTEEDKKYRWTLVDPSPVGNIYERVITNNLFDEVYPGILTINEKIVLSHEPVNIPFMFNIHGHGHAGCEYTDDMHLNCCAEHINYTPVSLKAVIDSGILSKLKSIHRLTTDKATERKKKRKQHAN